MGQGSQVVPESTLAGGHWAGHWGRGHSLNPGRGSVTSVGHTEARAERCGHPARP